MVLERFRLDGQVAVISGAGRGIGAAIAEALAEAGADVVIGARSEHQLAETAATVAQHGRRAVSVAGDLSTRGGGDSVEEAQGAFGGIDIVVNKPRR